MYNDQPLFPSGLFKVNINIPTVCFEELKSFQIVKQVCHILSVAVAYTIPMQVSLLGF